MRRVQDLPLCWEEKIRGGEDCVRENGVAGEIPPATQTTTFRHEGRNCTSIAAPVLEEEASHGQALLEAFLTDSDLRDVSISIHPRRVSF